MAKYQSIKQKQLARATGTERMLKIAERNERIVNLRKAGMALSEIGKKYGVSKERIRQIIEAYNVTVSENERVPEMIIRRTSAVVEERKENVKALLAAGKSTDEIAKKLGISGTLLLHTLALLRKEGVFIPKSEKQGKIDLNVARRMRAAGATLKTIATRFGVTIPSVQQLLDKHK